MLWFQKKLPMKQKLELAFGIFLFLMIVTNTIYLFLPLKISLFISAIIVIFSIGCSAVLIRSIAEPYVLTVERMEGLAAGDLFSAIDYTDYQDCVGRMTKAMHAFRENALQVRQISQDQAAAVKTLMQHFNFLAHGDLNHKIDDDFPKYYDDLKNNFNHTMKILSELIRSLQISSSKISGNAVEIASHTDELARRTESSAAGLEETAASIVQIDARLRETASAATTSVSHANVVISTVASGRDVAAKAVHAMSRVVESADGIHLVVDSLDKIAFQTRVLAMNAAIEAAHAGSSGSGFAVVADLVSQLAKRAEHESQTARRELMAVREDIDVAVQLIGDADKAFSSTAEQLDAVYELLNTISASTISQSNAVSEIKIAVDLMDHTTQQNAVMVVETSEAASALSLELSGLTDNAARFRID